MKIQVDVSGLVDFDPNALHDKYMAERAKRVRPEGARQYVDVTDNFEDLAADVFTPHAAKRAPVVEERDVLVLGAGLAGLLTSARLRQQGVDDFRIIEQGGDFGGAWYWNRYPGVRCDVEAYIYIPLLEEVGTIPSERYAPGHEILAHCQKAAEQFDLYSRALFNTSVTSVKWDESSLRWLVETDHGDLFKVKHVLASNGPFHRAKLPDIPGLRNFKGRAFHTSRWDYEYTKGDSTGGLTGLADQTVAIVGTGATGIQVLPVVARDAKHVYMIQRTPAAIDRRHNRPTDIEWYRSQAPGWQQQRMDDFMLTMIGQPQEPRLVDDCWTDIVTIIAQWSGEENPALAAASAEELQQLADYKKMEEIRTRIDTVVRDKATAEKLKPWYNLFCKRPGFSDDYLETFNRPNVSLIDTDGKGIDRITETGIVVNGDEIAVDCIVFATGFQTNAYSHETGGYELVGRDGVSLAEHWKNGMRSVHGNKVHHFPNFQILGAITQAAIAWNYPHVMGMQASHAARIVAQALDKDIVVEPSAADEDAWLAMMATKAVDRADFFAECTPGYYNNEGDTKGRPPLFASAYGGGPVEYEAELRKYEASLAPTDAAGADTDEKVKGHV